jgi:hypothetical protein
MRRWLVAGVIGWLAGGCGIECPTGQVAQDDACVLATDSDSDVETDVDTEVPPDTDVEPSAAIVRVEWSTTAVPNSNVVVLTCDDRRLMRETNFTFFADHAREFRVSPGETCQVTLQDAEGGLLPPGRLVVCSRELQSWEAERGRKKELPAVEVFACVSGCTDAVAENYDEAANLDDGSCTYVDGCTDPVALNFDPAATHDDGTCDYGGFGLLELAVFTDDGPADTVVRVVCDGTEALRLAPTLAWTTVEVNQVVEAGHDCTVFVDDAAGNDGPAGLVRVCGESTVSWSPTKGSGSARAYSVEVGSFSTFACSGCTDPTATNYDPASVVDDGSCTY